MASLSCKDFAADVDRDLLGQVAIGHRDGYLGDIADLTGQVVGHGVDAFGQVLPHAGHLGHLRLTAELALGADLARHARHLGGEHGQLLDHGVDDIGRLQELAGERPAVDVELHGLQEIALCDRSDCPGNFAGRPEQVVDQGVDRTLHIGPGATGQPEPDALSRLALAPDHLSDALELLRHPLVGGDDLIERIGDLAVDSEVIPGHAHRKVAATHGLK